MEHLHSCYHPEDTEEDSSPQPEQGAAAQVDGNIREGALSLDDTEKQQGDLNQGGHVSPYDNLGPEGDHNTQEPIELGPEEPALELAEVPRRHPRRHQIQFHFTLWQVQEMETIFQETQYPDVLTRRVLARNMNVPEDKVQNWFNNRRAKERASEKKAMLRRAPPGLQDSIIMMDPEED